MPVSRICPRCGDEYDESVAFCAKDGTRLVARGDSVELIGSVIADRYRIVSSIGEGGMGQVYLAEHVRMKRKSAIKIMRRSLVHDSDALQRFTREAENASQIAHPNVAAIFDFGETPDGIVYLAMEYVDGESLAEAMARDLALHPDVAADILGQAADALQAAHDLGILHRDLKPDNIMLARRPDRTYLVKLVDFGIARTMDSGDQKVTRTGFAIGTPAYMSPEQLAGDVLDARSDQYSLALVAFMALTGKDAFPAESSKESLIARLTSRPRTLQEAKQDVEWPLPLQAIFDVALSPEPADRFGTVSDFAHALSTAISAMTPTQTAELYRRALDVRVTNIAMRTPHSDLQSLRTPTVPRRALPTTSDGPLSGRRGALRDAESDRRETPRSAEQIGIPMGAASGAFPPLAPPTIRSTTSSIDISRTESATSPLDSSIDAAGDSSRRFANDTSARRPSSRRAVAIGASVVLVGVLGVWLATRSARLADGTSSTVSPLDSFAAVAGPPLDATIPDVRGVGAGTGTGAGFERATATTASSTMPRPASATQPATLSSPAVTAATPANASRDAQSRVDTKGATSTDASAGARFPEANARALIGGSVDVGDYTVRNNDVRVMIMSPPVSVWRDARAATWKQSHTRSGSADAAFEIVDPIEVWSGWRNAVRARLPLYVVEVAPTRTPWPDYKPESLFDVKRGDVASFRVRRDGADVSLRDAGAIPAFVNDQAHVTAGKPNVGEVVATLPADTFAPRPDGSTPTIDLLVIDRTRGDATITLAVPERMVRRLWDDFAAFRSAASPARSPK